MPLKTLFICLIFIICNVKINGQITQRDSLSRSEYIKEHKAQADSLNKLAIYIAGHDTTTEQLNVALSNIMKSLHIYSGFRDTTGLVQSFDNLSYVYRREKKYAQAKWFILQSNTLSRERKDTVNIIASLLNLAAIKIDIKDFNLAESDLKNAALLAKSQHDLGRQILVQQHLVTFYQKKGDTKQADLAYRKISMLKDSFEQGKEIKHGAITGATGHATAYLDTAKTLVDDNNNAKAVKSNSTIAGVLIFIVLALLCLLIFIKKDKHD